MTRLVSLGIERGGTAVRTRASDAPRRSQPLQSRPTRRPLLGAYSGGAGRPRVGCQGWPLGKDEAGRLRPPETPIRSPATPSPRGWQESSLVATSTSSATPVAAPARISSIVHGCAEEDQL